MMAPGLYPGIPMAEYLAIDAASSGGMKYLASHSPYAYRNRPGQTSPALSLGTLAHTVILEPERRILVQHEADLRTNAGKEAIVGWLVSQVGEPTVRPPAKAAVGTVLDLYLGELRPRLERSGETVATAADYSIACAMRDAVMARPHTRAVLEAEGQAEVTGLCEDPDYGVPVKVRPDRLIAGKEPVILSLKTTQSVGPRDYLRAAWTYGYPSAAWFYTRALMEITGERHRYWELAVESAQPHDVLLLEYTDREINDGAETMRQALDLYRRCREADCWPGAGYDWDRGEYTIAQIGRTGE